MAHARVVGVELVLRDSTVVGPEVREKLETSDVTKTNGLIVKRTDVNWVDSVDEHVSERLVHIMIRAEGREEFLVHADGLCDLKCSGICSMDRNDWRIDWGNKRNVVDGEFDVTGWGHRKSKMTVDAVSSLGGNRSCVAVQLSLRKTKGRIGWRGNACCDGSKHFHWEGLGDLDGGSRHDGNDDEEKELKQMTILLHRSEDGEATSIRGGVFCDLKLTRAEEESLLRKGAMSFWGSLVLLMNSDHDA